MDEPIAGPPERVFGRAREALAEVRELSQALQRQVLRLGDLGRLQEALRANPGFLDRVLENVPGGLVMVSPTGAILRANRAAIEFLGMPDDILSRREVGDWGTVTLREDGSECPVEEYPVTRCLATGEPQPPSTIGVRHPDGRVVWGVFYATPVHAEGGELLGVLVTFLDITERREAEEELRRSEDRLRTVLENAPDFVLLVDEEGQILYINRTFAPRRAEDVVGRSCLDFVAPEGQDRMRAALRSARDGVASHYELEAADTGRRYAMRLVPLAVAQERRRTFLLIATDVTEQRRIEAERRRYEHRVQQLQRMESLTILAGGVAHDFNNLLLAILGRTELALRRLPHGSEAATAREHLEEARTAILRARDLTDALLAYSGGGTFVFAPVDLNTVARETIRLLELQLLRGREVRCELAEDLPPVAGDATQLRQVVMNLLVNAAEASPAGGRIALRTRRERWEGGALRIPGEFVRGAELVVLEVEDEGVGMAEEVLAKAFDPFFTTKFTGRGLGLASVAGIVRGHRGGLHVESEAGRGSTFRVHLPADGATPRQRVEQSGGESRDGAVLVVDDERHVREVARATLEDEGYAVVTASGGREALRRVRAEGARLRLVILDLIMPDLGGEEVLEELRRTRPDLPVILTSGYEEEMATRRMERSSLHGFLKKPYRLEALLELVRAVCPPGEGSEPLR
ncbi:MAG: PAS domain S-box protein [Planctomycetota bacterium]|nr:MAG: PAS domain S-box protein [Planctomycetota bacterium]